MLLRTLGIAVLFTGLAAAQAPAAERAPRSPNRDMRTARTLVAAPTPAAGRVSRGVSRDVQKARTSAATQTPAATQMPAVAQTPAERASRSLNHDMRADRFRNAAEYARGDGFPVREEIQQFVPQRRTLQPDVGRPEENGRLSTVGIRGGVPALDLNVQR